MDKNIREWFLKTYPTVRDEVFSGGATLHEILDGKIPEESFNLDFAKPLPSEQVFADIERLYKGMGFSIERTHTTPIRAQYLVSTINSRHMQRRIIVLNEGTFLSLVTLPS